MGSSIADLKESIGIIVNSCEFGFLYKDIFSVIESYREERIPILGGDIYRKKNSNYIPTYDNWFFDKRYTKNDYLTESINHAVEYLRKISHYEDDVIVIVPNWLLYLVNVW